MYRRGMSFAEGQAEKKVLLSPTRKTVGEREGDRKTCPPPPAMHPYEVANSHPHQDPTGMELPFTPSGQTVLPGLGRKKQQCASGMSISPRKSPTDRRHWTDSYVPAIHRKPLRAGWLRDSREPTFQPMGPAALSPPSLSTNRV